MIKRGKPRLKSSERQIDRLRAEGWYMPIGVRFRRLYPGRNQRSAGHWVWCLEGYGVDCGSFYPVSDCLKAVGLSRGCDNEIYPESYPTYNGNEIQGAQNA